MSSVPPPVDESVGKHIEFMIGVVLEDVYRHLDRTHGKNTLRPLVGYGDTFRNRSILPVDFWQKDIHCLSKLDS